MDRQDLFNEIAYERDLRDAEFGKMDYDEPYFLAVAGMIFGELFKSSLNGTESRTEKKWTALAAVCLGAREAMLIGEMSDPRGAYAKKCEELGLDPITASVTPAQGAAMKAAAVEICSEPPHLRIAANMRIDSVLGIVPCASPMFGDNTEDDIERARR